MPLGTTCANQVRQDQLWRTYVQGEEQGVKNWRERWSWLQDELDQRNAKLQRLQNCACNQDISSLLFEQAQNSKTSNYNQIPYLLPPNTNGFYGLLNNGQGYKDFGPDLPILPLPSKYRLRK